ncbi:MAG: phage Gp19/Gp15/Gp42 family protein [Lentisphaeria bacterium]|nr:phage Gp19/Gp15/Gp42 family protein [Lentisphaeria bacterium]
MATNYATLDDIAALWRPLTPAEADRASALLPVVSSSLRYEAKKRGKDLDAMVTADEDLAAVAKSVTVDVVARTLMTSTDQEPMQQVSQAAMGYSVSGTFLVPGGGLFIKNSELARLGLTVQRVTVLEPYGGDPLV